MYTKSDQIKDLEKLVEIQSSVIKLIPDTNASLFQIETFNSGIINAEKLLAEYKEKYK